MKEIKPRYGSLTRGVTVTYVQVIAWGTGVGAVETITELVNTDPPNISRSCLVNQSIRHILMQTYVRILCLCIDTTPSRLKVNAFR